MLCDYCHGTRLIQTAGMIQPCPECGGHGSLHCCDGLQAQPEPDSAAATDAIGATDAEMGMPR
jgi:hypothetical protein